MMKMGIATATGKEFEELRRFCEEMGVALEGMGACSESIVYDEDYKKIYISKNAKESDISEILKFLLRKGL